MSMHTSSGDDPVAEGSIMTLALKTLAMFTGALTGIATLGAQRLLDRAEEANREASTDVAAASSPT
jgi:hypothetical protein